MKMSRRLLLGSLLSVAVGLFGCAQKPSADDPSLVSPARVGVCSWSWKMPMRQVVEKMEADGIRGVNLALVPFISNDRYHGGTESPETWRWIKSKVERGDIVVMSTMVSTVGEDYTTLETIRKTGGIVPDAHWAENQVIVERGAQLTAELKCRYLLTHAGFLDHADPKAYAKYLDRVTWMRDTCMKYGVFLILETGQESADELAEFLPKVPGVFVNFDPANMILYGKGVPREALRKLAPWIKQIHVKDAVGTKVPGTWGTEVPWGEGEVGGKDFIRDLAALGFSGNFVVEREAGDDRVADIERAVRSLTGER